VRLGTHEQAIAEAREARKWARARGHMAEQTWARSYRQGRERLTRYPRAGRVFVGEYRRLVLTGTPYALIYRLEPNRVFIVAVAHGKREPGYWQRRLEQR
jgi:plasmid stabilization system protein ParE